MKEWPNPEYSDIVFGSRHPKNRFGQGSNEFYEEEFRLYGGLNRFESKAEFHQWKKANTPKCPICGVPYGYNFGTGDCECIE